MRNADEHFRNSHFFSQLAGRPGKGDLGLAPHLVANFDVAPVHAAGPAGAQGFEHGLLGGKSSRIMLR